MLWVPTVPHIYFLLLTAPMAGWDICNMMCLAGGSGLEQAIVDADVAMPPEGLPVASERAGGEGRRLELKRKAREMIRYAAEDLRCSLRALHQQATLQIFSLRSGT
jgi:hypothetical protein